MVCTAVIENTLILLIDIIAKLKENYMGVKSHAV